MIVAISGMPGSGKSTVARELAKLFGLKHYSTGELMRKIAKKRGVTLAELDRTAEKDPSIDAEIDGWTKQLAEREDDFVIDSRLAWHFIPHSIKVFLVVSPEEAARRIFAQKRPGEKAASYEETLKMVKERFDSERTRYKKYYGIDYCDRNNYDLVVDTTHSGVKEVVKAVADFIITNAKLKNKSSFFKKKA